MANVKISDLTALVSTDLATTDLLPIVDGSEALDADKTKNISVADLSAGLYESATALGSTSVATDDGLLIYDTSAVTLKSITLANLFDWDTWVPTVTYSGGSADPTTSAINYAGYFQLGKLVVVSIDCTITRGSGDRTQTTFSLPVAANGAYYASAGYQTVTSVFPLAAPVYVNATLSAITVAHGAMSRDGDIVFQCTYQTT